MSEQTQPLHFEEQKKHVIWLAVDSNGGVHAA
jgi:hypothetical protein